MQEKLTARPRVQDSKEDLEAARERQKAEGSESLFDTLPTEDLAPEEEETLTEQVVIPGKKFTEVGSVSVATTHLNNVVDFS